MTVPPTVSSFAAFTAFLGSSRLASGALAHVAAAAQAAVRADPLAAPQVFDNACGRIVDLDLSGTPEDLARRYAARPDEADGGGGEAGQPGGQTAGRGRPRLGVVAREVTLLPRHWAWLAEQPGGASVALRRLVDEARKANAWSDHVRRVREATGRFATTMAGDEPGFEEAMRALYAGDTAGFAALAVGWPPDVRAHAVAMAEGSFARETS